MIKTTNKKGDAKMHPHSELLIKNKSLRLLSSSALFSTTLPSFIFRLI